MREEEEGKTRQERTDENEGSMSRVKIIGKQKIPL
jgi:hypothetical protein